MTRWLCMFRYMKILGMTLFTELEKYLIYFIHWSVHEVYFRQKSRVKNWQSSKFVEIVITSTYIVYFVLHYRRRPIPPHVKSKKKQKVLTIASWQTYRYAGRNISNTSHSCRAGKYYYCRHIRIISMFYVIDRTHVLLEMLSVSMSQWSCRHLPKLPAIRQEASWNSFMESVICTTVYLG